MGVIENQINELRELLKKLDSGQITKEECAQRIKHYKKQEKDLREEIKEMIKEREKREEAELEKEILKSLDELHEIIEKRRKKFTLIPIIFKFKNKPEGGEPDNP